MPLVNHSITWMCVQQISASFTFTKIDNFTGLRNASCLKGDIGTLKCMLCFGYNVKRKSS